MLQRIIYGFYVLLYHFVGHSLFELVAFCSFSNIIKRNFSLTLRQTQLLRWYVRLAFCGKVVLPSQHGSRKQDFRKVTWHRVKIHSPVPFPHRTVLHYFRILLWLIEFSQLKKNLSIIWKIFLVFAKFICTHYCKMIHQITSWLFTYYLTLFYVLHVFVMEHFLSCCIIINYMPITKQLIFIRN